MAPARSRLSVASLVQEHLEDSRENCTRFVLLASSADPPADADKMSLRIELPHHPGALHRALEPFARREIDLLKLEGRPVKSRPWEYSFYLELRGAETDPEVIAVLDELKGQRGETKIFGSYREAAIPMV